jgi:leader peptidase (prepilin peptidase) / N-methyltransferase
VVTPLAILFGLAGGAWGLVSDRIAVRWPAHDEAETPAGRAPGWRTAATVLIGAAGLGMVPVRFDQPVPVAVFGAYVVALTLLLATDLDQRLLPNEITLPAIPLALVFGLADVNPLVAPGALAVAAVAAVVLPLLLLAFSIPFGAGAFGQGDVKLLVSVGLMVGAFRLIVGVVYGFLLAGVVILALLALRRISLRSFIPMGPFLVIGAFWAVLGPG